MYPLGRRIIVKPFAQQEEKTAGGIIIPNEVVTSELRKGEVIALGTESEGFEVGQSVLFERGRGDEFKYNDDPVLILNEGDIVAVLTKGE